MASRASTLNKVMNFKHDLAEISKKELHKEGIKVPKEWDDYRICMRYLEIHHRWFDSSVPYMVVFSRELWRKLPRMSVEEQAAIRDIVNRLKSCQPITAYMSRDIHAISVKKSDFLLKNWNIYHLHLERVPERYRNPNLLFFQPMGQVVHMIDVRPHPKGAAWFDRGLFDIIYDNWPHLLIFMPGVKPTLPVPDEGVHGLLKKAVSLVPFRNGALFPTNLGVAASGDSTVAVRTADRIFNRLTEWQLELAEREAEIKESIREAGIDPPAVLDYTLVVEDGFFVAYELQTHAKIRMFPVP